MSARRRKNLYEYKLTKAKYLQDHEYDDLLRHLKKIERTHPRDAVLINLALHTGARAQELLNIRPQDLDRSDMSVHIIGMKDSDDRDVPLPEWLFLQLELLAKCTKGKTVFDISYPRLDQIWKHHRTCKKKFHSLRHTFAVRAYKRTKDIKLIRRLLGHRDFKNTLIYLDFVYSPDETRKLLVG